jgi:Cu/Zn superoxide dismutase
MLNIFINFKKAGDLGNVLADSNGVINVSLSSNLLTLNGTISAIGRVMIIHQNPDDGITQPTVILLYFIIG